jgi:hypothetical protein
MNKKLLNNKLPKFFNVTINYVTGESKEFKCASWNYNYSQDMIEYLTTDNEYKYIIKSNVLDINPDKNYTKIIEEIIKEQSAKSKEK